MYAHIKQSTSLPISFKMVDSTGAAVTGIADGSFTKRISKNGSSTWGAMTVTIAEGENGWYHGTLSSSHTDTNGVLGLDFAAAGARNASLGFLVKTSQADDIIALLPTSLDSGNMRSSVKAMDSGIITATVIAADAIGASELATDAVAEIRDAILDRATSSHTTAGTVGKAIADAAVQAAAAAVSAADLQTRTPAALDVSGFMKAQVKGMDASTVTAAAVATDAIDNDALAASAVTEITSGLATGGNVTTSTSTITALLPASLSGGKMRSQVEGMDAGTVSAAAVATGAIDADALAADAAAEISTKVLADLLDLVYEPEDPTLTFQGWMRRQESFWVGMQSGLRNADATWTAYLLDGLTPAIVQDKDTTVGTRAQATSLAGEV